MLERWLSALQVPDISSTRQEDRRSDEPTIPISEDSAKQEAIATLVQILRDIEATPLRVSDNRALRTAFVAYLNSRGLMDERELVRVLQFRFSMDYLPGLSQLDLSRFAKSSTERTVEDSPRMRPPSTSQLLLSPLPPLPPSRVLENLLAGKSFMMCSIRRYQQALWTTYRLFLDGTREFESNGSLGALNALDPPVFLLGTKTLKSGMSAQCLVWRTPEVRQWKEKHAAGRISRSNAFYLGSPLVPPTDDAEDPNNVSQPLPGGPIAVNVERRGMEKLLYLTAAIPRSSSSSSNISSTNPSSGSSEVAVEVSGKYGGNGHTVAGNSDAAPAHQAGGGSPVEEVDETTLETALRNPLADSIKSRGVVLLRSRPPRKVSAGPGGRSGMMTVAFGKDSRVRTASRKNLALDLAQSHDWSADQDRVPVLQLGKMAEDTFAVDFYGISPFQAFVVALAAFDR